MPPSAGSRSEHSHHSGYDDDETLMLEQAMDKADRASNRLEAIRAQALRDARDAERGDFRVAAPAPANAKADAREMASLVGQLERYAEAKTGRARTTGLRPYDDDEDAFNALGGSNLANRGSNSARSGAETLAAPKRAAQSKATGTNRWGARRSANAAASTRRNGLNASYGMGPENGDVEGRVGESRFQDENRRGDVGSVVDPTYQNSLVGGWDAGSVQTSRWETSSVPDSDVRSVYSAALEDSFGGAYVLPDAPKDEVARVDERASSAAENLTRQRAALEAQMSNIARATRASDAAASLETDGMFTAGKTKTGVGVIDFFARDPGGAGPKGSLAKSVNERAKMSDAKNKWLSPAPARRLGRTTAPPEEPSPIVRMLRSVFGCGCGGR